MKKGYIYIISLVFMFIMSACSASAPAEPAAAGAPVSAPATPAPILAARPAADTLKAAPAATGDNQAAPVKPAGVSQIFVRRDTNGADGGFMALVESMEAGGEPFYMTAEAPNGLIGKSDVVLLFYNGQWDGRGGTNTDLINAVVEAVAAHPDGFGGEIVIADNGQGDGSLDHARPNSANRDQSVQDVVDKQKALGVRVTGYLWDDIMDSVVAEYDEGDDSDGYVLEPGVSEETKLAFSYPKFTTDYGTKLSVKMGVWDGAEYDNERLKLINMPVLKSHGTYRATAAVKNYMGMGSQSLSARAGGSQHNSVALGGMGEMMAKSRVPVLNILDMIYIGSRGGPWVTYDEASEYMAIAASTDPFALDYWAVKNVLMPEAERAGNRNIEAMDPDSSVPGSFGYWMNLSLDEIEKAGYTGFVFGAESVAVHEN